MSDGGPAFPFTEWHKDGSLYIQNPGMTLRQWYAGMALQGIKWNGYESLDASAQVAYAMADAMLKERGKS